MSALDSREVVVPLPPEATAPGFRDGFSTLADMRVRQVADGWLAIAPREGAGTVREYFRLERLCDAAAPPSDKTWAPLLEHPPLHADENLLLEGSGDDQEWRDRLRGCVRS